MRIRDEHPASTSTTTLTPAGKNDAGTSAIGLHRRRRECHEPGLRCARGPRRRAALVAGANHIIAAAAPMTDEVADRVLVLLGVLPSAATAGMAASQALQQFDRAFPHRCEDLTDWPIVHVGLPGSAG